MYAHIIDSALYTGVRLFGTNCTTPTQRYTKNMIKNIRSYTIINPINVTRLNENRSIYSTYFHIMKIYNYLSYLIFGRLLRKLASTAWHDRDWNRHGEIVLKEVVFYVLRKKEIYKIHIFTTKQCHSYYTYLEVYFLLSKIKSELNKMEKQNGTTKVWECLLFYQI